MLVFGEGEVEHAARDRAVVTISSDVKALLGGEGA